MKIFAISGSLRADSSNHNVLRFLKDQLPASFDFTIYENLGKIPPFDPGIDNDQPPEPVDELRNFMSEADAVIICTPEYAFGVPGQLKNALDWTVSSGSLADKPLALITASTNGTNAHAALLLILGALSAQLVEAAALLIPFIRSKIDSNGNITDNETAENLKTVLTALLNAIN
ncbi:NADPH-dependent FMN reductase [Mucilaginibacter sp.]|uniref:NADPH-dependent FMN reductase n=1 Tax=Mucilaginibacter sp. TaxID=1882438 RepID=UPI003D140EDD